MMCRMLYAVCCVLYDVCRMLYDVCRVLYVVLYDQQLFRFNFQNTLMMIDSHV